MARRAGIIRISDFSGGEAATASLGSMNPKFSSLLQNCYVSDRGGVAKIPGYASVNTTAVAETLTSGFEFRKSDGISILLAAGGGKIYKVDGTSLTAIKTGLSASATVAFASMNNLCLMVNGTDPPMKYDGTTVSALGGSPPATASLVHVHKSRVWMIENGNQMLATHSALANPEDYTTAGNAGYFDFKTILRRGDRLMGMASFAEFLIFFFQDTIVAYSGSNPTASGDFRIDQIIEGVGFVWPGSGLTVGTDMLVLSKSGMKSFKQIIAT